MKNEMQNEEMKWYVLDNIKVLLHSSVCNECDEDRLIRGTDSLGELVKVLLEEKINEMKLKNHETMASVFAEEYVEVIESEVVSLKDWKKLLSNVSYLRSEYMRYIKNYSN